MQCNQSINDSDSILPTIKEIGEDAQSSVFLGH